MSQEVAPAFPGGVCGEPGTVLIRQTDLDGADAWCLFDHPVEILTAKRREEILPALERLEGAVERGLLAAGFLGYEAAPAFDPALAVRPGGTLPLLWFGLYERSRTLDTLPRPPQDLSAMALASADLSSIALASEEAPSEPDWKPSITRPDYERAVSRIRAYIAAGDTYQVNYSFRLSTAFTGDPWEWFLRLHKAQAAPYAAYVNAGDFALASVSPELFFRLDGERIGCRPMKGTRARGLTWEEDRENALALSVSEKDRAENIMIVDMVRNDLARVARRDTVRVTRQFEVERYPTVFQMTSTVEALTAAPFREIFAALFPCASITGAPKVRTMQIIAELETAPRDIYTGCIGMIGPGRRAQFNVAIRTVQIDRANHRAVYGTGGGIVWDSREDLEYEECLTKALVLGVSRPDFQLLETIFWKPETGYFLLERHLKRLARSAEYFQFAADIPGIRARLESDAHLFSSPCRVRLRVGEAGDIQSESTPLPAPPASGPWRLKLAASPVNSRDVFLYHKTTQRQVYDKARAECLDADDVILWNEKGEITESTIANVVIRSDEEFFTPPVACGLLGGVYREELIEQGKVREKILTAADVRKADALYLVNSVREWMPAVLLPV
ncbi:MAG: aminodeoxychorismate synthase component I [Lentisphaerae bacterium]|nr:aminodeoxychorismate synthase component I [Lentisphaerota bacterium]